MPKKRILIILSFLAAYVAATAASIAMLPQMGPAWRNVEVNNNHTVFTIFRDSHGLVWLGTNGGLYFYDGTTTRPAGGNHNPPFQIYSIVERQGKLYAGSNNGLLVYDISNGSEAVTIEGTPKEIRNILAVGGTLWIASLDGIYSFDMESGQVSNKSQGLPHRSTYSLLRDRRGVIYAGTYNGLARFNEAKGLFEAVELPANMPRRDIVFVNSLLESDDGSTIYVGTEGALYTYLPSTDRWAEVESFDGNNIKSLSRRLNDNIIVGTDNGVFSLNANGSLQHYKHDSRKDNSLSDNEIWCVDFDGSQVWAGHERGFSIASDTRTMYSAGLAAFTDSGEGNDISNIYRDRSGRLWLGGTGGLIRIDNDGTSHWYRHNDSRHALHHNRIRSIMEDSDGNLWISSDGGIERFNPASDSFDNFHIADSQGTHNSHWVYAMVEDKDHFWVGSYLGGIHYVDKSKFAANGGTVTADFSINADSHQFKNNKVNLANELVNNVVLDNEGRVWILLFRDRNLTVIAPDGKADYFDILEMTGSYPSNICTDNAGRLWCAVDGGVVLFDRTEKPRICRFAVSPEMDKGVLAMGPVGNDLWVSTVNNVWRIDGNTLETSIVALPPKRYMSIYDDKATGKVYLGSADEITVAEPKRLGPSSNLGSISVAVDNGTPFSRSANSQLLRGISLPSGGGIKLLAGSVDFSPDIVRQYAYKLTKNAADSISGWTYLPHGANEIALSGLSAGNYILLVKDAGMAGNILSLPVHVAQPWYLQWWALALYTLIVTAIALIVILYFRRRNLRAMHEQERRRALENVERKLTFLSDISHDLKTPLSMIMGPVSVLKEKAADPQNRHILENIYDNAVKLNNMIHRTLELKQLEDNGENLLIMSTFDLVDFCRTIFEAFNENNSSKKFVFHTEAEQIMIEADAVKMESVVTNLLSNACKYSDDGATISMGLATADGKVRMVVSDDGMGIPEKDQSLVFQRMFRSPSTASLREGTGLGLYLIKHYLELMGGTIDLFSRTGEGSSFVITLPMSEQTSVPDGEAADDAAAGKQKILIVEDNSQIAGFLKDLLRTNYKCMTAANGRAGLALAASFEPDLIIVDQMMPLMSGTEMVKRIKQNKRLALTPIIMLTAKDDVGTENESTRLGVDVFMSKPFDPAALQLRVRNLIETRAMLRNDARIATITEPKPIEAESQSEKQLAMIAKTIEENIAEPEMSVAFLSEKTGLGSKQLYRIIKKYMGVSPGDYIRNVRLQKAAMLLSQQRFTVAEVGYMVGFKSPSYFTKCFTEHYGTTPSQYKE